MVENTQKSCFCTSSWSEHWEPPGPSARERGTAGTPGARGFHPCPWEGPWVQGSFTCRLSGSCLGSAWGWHWRTQGLNAGTCMGRGGSTCTHQPGLRGCWAHWVPKSLASAHPAWGAEAMSPAPHEERHGWTKCLGGLEDTPDPWCVAASCQGGQSPLTFLARTPARGLAFQGRRQPSASPSGEMCCQSSVC